MIEATRWRGHTHGPASARSGNRPRERTMTPSLITSHSLEETRAQSHEVRSHVHARRGRRWCEFGLLELALLSMILFINRASAVFINFENCLDPGIVNSNNPVQLQFVPLFVWATFNTSSDSHNLNVTVYGNVTGIATQQPIPLYNDPQWTNPNETLGKIPDIAGPADDQKYTTFETSFHVLDYTPYNPDATRFCNSSSLLPCPLAPAFNVTANQ